MAFQLIWSPTAKFDLQDISTFIAEDNSKAAKNFVKSVFSFVERLVDFPESGRIVPEFNDLSFVKSFESHLGLFIG